MTWAGPLKVLLLEWAFLFALQKDAMSGACDLPAVPDESQEDRCQ